MGAIKLTHFGGIVPRTSKRLIGETSAQIAVNCRLSSGELMPYNKPKVVGSVAKQGPLKTLYRAYENGDYAWFSWPDVVNVVKAPLFGAAKWVYTGDFEPRITTLAMAKSGGGNTYPNTAYMLGIPRPQTAPTVTPSGGSGDAVTRYYGYTFLSNWDEEGPVSPLAGPVTGKVDDTWAITGMDASPANSGSVTGVHAADVTTFTNAGFHWLREGETIVIDGDDVVVAVVVDPEEFKVAGDYSSATAWTRKTPWNTTTKNLYRSTGTTGQFQLVAEGITGTTYDDTLTDSQILGDELISADWEPPPVGLVGLFLLPSGSLGGFVGNRLRFSEPNQPHAWPQEYELTTDYPIVAAASFGTGVLAATESRPFIVTGIEPGQMSGQHWEEVLPCASARSMVSLGDMALYASPFGLIAGNSSGCQNWSASWFTKHQIDEYAPDTMVSAYSERRLFVRYFNGNKRSLVFNLAGDGAELTETHFDSDTIYADDTTGKLYFSDGSTIFEFDPLDGYPMSQDWMGKEIVLERPMNLGAAKVSFDLAIDPAVAAALEAEREAVAAANAHIAATGKVNGAWNAKRYNTELWNGSDLVIPPATPPDNEVTFQLYTASNLGNPILRHARTVTQPTPFSLPSGYKADTVMVRVISQCAIKSVELGPTKQSLGAV